jgi:uncharacterized membrane protein YphA (DoxX/SURF4 family)
MGGLTLLGRGAGMTAVLLVLRVLLGGLLVVAGTLKAHDGIAATASTIAGYRILPPFIVAPLGVVLPYFEIGLGAYLVLGLFVRAAGLIAAAQFAVFAGAVASLVVRHIPANCGCFGAGQNVPPSWGHVAVDLGLALLALWVALRGPGLLAVDNVLGRRNAFEQAHQTEDVHETEGRQATKEAANEPTEAVSS